MDKYYTPELSEFHIGFEYEYWYSFTNKWIKSIVTIDTYHLSSYDGGEWDDIDRCYLSPKAKFRVKIIDKIDICSFDFIYAPENGWEKYYHKDNINDYELRLMVLPNKVIVIESVLCGFKSNRFVGNIKNKSELKRILDQINLENLYI